MTISKERTDASLGFSRGKASISKGDAGYQAEQGPDYLPGISTTLAL